MITLGDIWEEVNGMLRKEISGNTVTPMQFNQYLRSSGYEFFDREYNNYENSDQITASLRRFYVDLALTFTTGTSTNFPSNLYYPVLLMYGNVEVDIVTESEWGDLIGDALLAPDATHPIAKYTSTQMLVRPTSIASADFKYFKRPAEPVFDYYYDINDNLVYLPVGAVHVWTTGEVDSSGNVKTTGDPNYTSQSVELDFEENDKVRIKNMVLQKLGIQLMNQGAVQYATGKDAEMAQS